MVEPLVIERRKLFEQVAAHIEGQILAGKLKPGDQLPPERDLQLRFGVGRPAIREALISLQKAGLIETSNGVPARVSMPTAQNVVTGIAPAVRQMLSSEAGQKSFQDVRLFFEVGLARHAARHATDEDLKRLKAALEDNRAAIGDRAAFVRTDIAFHLAVAEVRRNPVISTLHDAMTGWLREQRVVTLAAPAQERVAHKAHKLIYEAVAARNPDAAEEAMRAHLEQLAAAFWREREGAGEGA